MKKFSIVSKTIITLLLLGGLLSNVAIAQRGYSNASMAMGEMRSNQFQCPQPNEIYIDEYVNYHTHDIPLPKKGESVHVDVRWGNDRFSPYSKEAILQVGFTTPRIQTQEAPPINVALVIDKSGSMNGSRIEYTRMAAIEFVKRLREEDIVSIVTFDHNINVVLPAQSAANKDNIINAIQGITAGGSTNLNGGLVTGYQEVVKNYSDKINNRVLMLTDALTNTGQIDPEQIVQNSMNYTAEQEIDITVIGVGVNFNNNLSRQITSSSRSSIHFINDAKDIKKVFIDEVESLLSPVARDVAVKITLPDGITFKKVYGYSPSFNGKEMTLQLNNMNNGLTQVIIIECELDDAISKQNTVKAELTYYDIHKNKTQQVGAEAELRYNDKSLLIPDVLKDEEVKKNYTIARLAYGLQNMATNFQQNQNSAEAQRIIKQALDEAKNRYPYGYDADIQRVANILSNYDQQLMAIKN